MKNVFFEFMTGEIEYPKKPKKVCVPRWQIVLRSDFSFCIKLKMSLLNSIVGASFRVENLAWKVYSTQKEIKLTKVIIEGKKYNIKF